MDSFEAVKDNEAENEKPTPTEEIPKSPYLDNIDSPDELGEDSQGSSHSRARDEEEGKDAVDSREENAGTPEEMEVDDVQQQTATNDEEPSESAKAVENEDSTIDGRDVCGNATQGPASPEPGAAEGDESNSPENEDLPAETGSLNETENELETSRENESPAEPMEVDEADNRTKGVDADTSCDGEQNESHQPAEEVDCSAMSYAEDKDNSESNDPFESLKNSSDKIQSNATEKENDDSTRQSNHDEDSSLQNNEDATLQTNQDDDSEDESVRNDVEDSRQSGRSTPIRDGEPHFSFKQNSVAKMTEFICRRRGSESRCRRMFAGRSGRVFRS